MPGLGANTHPETEILDDLLGEAGPETVDRLRAHLTLCHPCRALRDEWLQTLEDARRDAAARRRWPLPPRGGDRFCRLARRFARPCLLADLGAEDASHARGRLTGRGGPDVALQVEGLRAPRPGRRYVAWCTDSDACRPLGFVRVEGSDRTVTALVLPVGAAPGHTIIVTEEPSPLPPRPTGAPVLSGRLCACGPGSHLLRCPRP